MKVSKSKRTVDTKALAERIKKNVLQAKKASDPITKASPKLSKSTPIEVDADAETKISSFSELDLVPELLLAINGLKFSKPTPIQAEAIPHALLGKDIIGLAVTGSGKTAAFAIPILQALWHAQTPYFGLVMAPTRELAYQIKETFDALGSGMGVRTCCVVGGMDMMDQARDIMRKPHILVATPGRIMDHLEHTKGFSLKNLKYLVMDEADRLLDMDFGPSIDKILKRIPTNRTTYLFSATMTSKVDKLQRASLRDPVRVAVSTKFQTADNLTQSMMLVPDGKKDTYLVHLLNELHGKSMIIFARTCSHTHRTALLTRMLGFSSIPLHGKLTQSQRLGALNKFKAGQASILVCTDVGARGLDIPSVDVVINYDIPTDSKSYVHRVGRTARAGRAGKSVSLVSQYEIEMYLRIEKALGKRLPKDEDPPKEEIEALYVHVLKATAEAIKQLKQLHEKWNTKKGGRDDRDKEEK
ncbi:ribosomal RNA processing protein [Scheffersomyces spartinae]|uniref:ATP-dependent rRNA helicase RRP3 n=1 Tax=Scheffersomyces spartinae TaxID=45513 RepID=A0A9P7VBH1_9ASCO|nr:ribosomal RNA processing protein [Scheffersomyces spartinae]KAG7194665.1 ribosomal RNA processing protein [Scheffersomyces spartinae]